MKKLILIIIFFCSFVSASFAGESKTIRFATEATYPPFEYVDNAGAITGFDIDLAKALCKQINAECTFSTQGFSSLITSLNLRKFDALIAAIGITPAREQQVSFTEPYYIPTASFVAPTDKHYTLEGITGKTIGAQEGSTFAQYLAAKYRGKITLKTYGSVQDALLDLAAGRLDIVLADTPIITAWLKREANNKSFSIIGEPIVDKEYFGAGYGIAVRKNNTELLNALNKALVEVKQNGTYKIIYSKYFE